MDDDDSRTGSSAAGTTAPGSAPLEQPHHEDGHARSQPPAGQTEDRPVVPQLTRKQAQRVNAPVRGMIISMAVLMALVLVFYFLQPRPDAQTYRPDVDVSREAGFAADVAAFDPLVPDLGDGWSPNYARWEGQQSDGVDSWEAGWLTPSGGFIGLTQTDQANPTWTLEQIDGIPQTSTVEAGGIDWQAHFGEDSDDEPRIAWIAEIDGTDVILQGTAPDAEFDHAARAVAEAAADGS